MFYGLVTQRVAFLTVSVFQTIIYRQKDKLCIKRMCVPGEFRQMGAFVPLKNVM